MGERAAPLHLPVSCTPDPQWLIVEEGFNLAREHEVESILSVANGYAGTRAALAEGSSLSAPATFIAGIYDTPAGAGALPELALAPDWMTLSLLIQGVEFKLESGRPLLHRRILDLRQGILWRDWRQEGPGGAVGRILGIRLASLADRHLLLQSVLLESENFESRARVEARIAWPQGASARSRLAPASGGQGPTLALQTLRSGLHVAFAAAGVLRTQDGATILPQVESAPGRHLESWTLDVRRGRTYRLDRMIVVYTSRDAANPEETALRHLSSAQARGFDTAMAEHVSEWARHWERASIEIWGDEPAQRAVRFAIYHLISSANPEDTGVSIGARGLTGDSYKGHVFWDTEIYMLPFYSLTDPKAARALLMYRYHTLEAARGNAREKGYPGALFAWESADTGKDVTPPYLLTPDGRVERVLCGEQEHHINSAIAYGCWTYWQATADDSFILEAGAELLIETARFWRGRAERGDDGKFHIRQVIGPDEYHPGVDDSAYTNAMARWNLERGAEIAAICARRWPREWAALRARLRLGDSEPGSWLEVAEGLYSGLDLSTGLIEEFSGYLGLEDTATGGRGGAPLSPGRLLLERERVRASRWVKQADVVLLLHLLHDAFDGETLRRNFDFYEPRTAHGSSLSPGVHALVAARLGDLERAMRYFRMAAEIDLANNMGNAAGGVHIAALGGLWQSVVFGFAGLRLTEDRISLDPRLPQQWKSLSIPLRWRGTQLRINIVPDSIEIASQGPGAILCSLRDQSPIRLEPGASLRLRLHAPKREFERSA